MKKINEIDVAALIQYCKNKEELEKIDAEKRALEKRIEYLKALNKTIEETGSLPVFNSDDIPF